MNSARNTALDSRRTVKGRGAGFALAFLLLCFLLPARSQAQSAAPKPASDITGVWQGTLHAGARDFRTVVKIAKTRDGKLQSTLYSNIDQGGGGTPVTSTVFQGETVRLALDLLDGSYEGKLSADGDSITGILKAGSNSYPLILARATPATEWTIPPPPQRLPPMAADANPEFEVATIKPTKPGARGVGFHVRGRQFSTFNPSLEDLMVSAYEIHPRQIAGAPDWAGSDKYDISAEPDAAGAPSDQQWRLMLQKLLADRFNLKFHREKRELTVYAITVAKNGSKLTKSAGDPSGLPSLGFRGFGVLTARNTTMDDLAGLLQQAVLDRPVVDQTDLKGRYDFLLKWTPDETQFAALGGYKAPATESADAPPDLFTAIQKQLGLKLISTKAPVDVLVIDHVDKPSPN